MAGGHNAVARLACGVTSVPGTKIAARAALLVAATVAAAVLGSQASAGPGGSKFVPLNDSGGSSGFLAECDVPRAEAAKTRCYVRRLLAHIEASGDPADELPRIDRRTQETGGFLSWNCHMLMHAVGRRYARRHDVTLLNLQHHVPRSNNPNCSAGFGMGLVMHLGPKILRLGPKGALGMCGRLPTRFRSYTCIHGLGHAFMRVYHGALRYAVGACGELRRHAPDCAQGAYHDYWISLRGADETNRPENAETSARSLCARQISAFVRGCWYRFFLERPPARRVREARDIRRLCHGLGGLQRSGCVAAASLVVSADPFEQTHVCVQLGYTAPHRPTLGRAWAFHVPAAEVLARLLDDSALRTSDSVSCLRGVLVPAVAGLPSRQLGLIGMCGDMRAQAERGCYEWFGKTLAVVTDGAFGARGCSRLRSALGRAACTAGARAIDEPLVTFS